MHQGSLPGGARAALRHATEAVHLRLHEAPQFQAIADGRLNRAGYAELLGRIHSFHQAIDAAAGAAGDPSQRRRRLALLEADLAFLGAAPAPPPLWHAPREDGAALGCLYVAQGSAIGGRLIWRQISYLFGDAPEGRRFFAGAGGEGAAWRALLADIEREGRDSARRSAMIAGAASAFALFERLIESAPAYV